MIITFNLILIMMKSENSNEQSHIKVCNNLSSCQQILFALVFYVLLSASSTHFECFVLLSNQYRIAQSTSLRPVSLLAHCSTSGSDIICNSPIPLLIDIVYFSLLHMIVNLTILEHIYQRDISLLSSTNAGTQTEKGLKIEITE